MQGTGMRAFEELGLADEIKAVSYSNPKQRTLFKDTRDEIIVAIEPGMSPLPPSVAISRKVLHETLAEKVADVGVPVQMGTTVEALEEQAEGIQVTLTDGSKKNYDLVVGADGIRSKVREMIFGIKEPEFSGFSAWRYVMPRPADQKDMEWYWGHDTTIGIVPISDDLIYVAGTSAEPGNPKYERKELPRLYREIFNEYEPIMGNLLSQITEPERVVYTPMEQVILPPPWHKGRVVILGDAAHATCPFWAQGASMGIEDAALLVRFLSEETDLLTVLSDWFERRYPRCMFVQKGSFETGKMSHTPPQNDKPKFFPPPVKVMIQERMKQQGIKLSEPY